jgi:hypothetical protein
MVIQVVEKTVELMQTAVDPSVQISVVINNRAGGNAPLIARQAAERFAARHRES